MEIQIDAPSTMLGAVALGSRLQHAALDLPGMEGCFFLGGSLAASARNHIPGKPDAQVVGSPDVHPTHLRLRGARDFIRLPFTDFNDTAVVCVNRGTGLHTSDPTTRSVLVGTAGNGGDGFSLYRDSAGFHGVGRWRRGDLGLITDGERLDAVASLTGVSGTDVLWRTMYAHVNSVGGIYHKSLSSGSNATATLPSGAAARLVSPSSLFIGGGPDTTLRGSSDIACVIVMSQLPGDPQRDALRDMLTALYAPVGITI